MTTTTIEWTDRSWNPVRGCERVSPGCESCYAEVMAARFSDEGMWGHGFAVRTPAGGRWTRKVAPVPEKLAEPLRWKKPSKVFVNSTSDLFHDDVPFEFIAAVFGVMAACPQHTFQILTKRPGRMAEFFAWASTRASPAGDLVQGLWHVGADFKMPGTRYGVLPDDLGVPVPDGIPWPLPNVWLGVSVEDQKRADERIPHLLKVPAVVRFLSVEPQIGPVDLSKAGALGCDCPPFERDDGEIEDRCSGRCVFMRSAIDKMRRVDWVIVGGESGPGARPFDLAWARSIVAQCKAAGVAVFFKQAGAEPEVRVNGLSQPVHMHAKKGNDLAEIPEDLRIREFPNGRP